MNLYHFIEIMMREVIPTLKGKIQEETKGIWGILGKYFEEFLQQAKLSILDVKSSRF